MSFFGRYHLNGRQIIRAFSRGTHSLTIRPGRKPIAFPGNDTITSRMEEFHLNAKLPLNGICDRSLESRNFRKFHLRQKSPEWHVFQVASLWKIPPHPQNHFRVFSRVHWKKQNTTYGLDTLMNLLSVLITQLLALVI